MAQQEFSNVLDPQYARYINLRGEIEAYLEEKYGTEMDFKHEHDRWSFCAPEKLAPKEIKKMTKEIVARCEKAKREAESASGSATAGEILDPTGL